MNVLDETFWNNKTINDAQIKLVSFLNKMYMWIIIKLVLLINNKMSVDSKYDCEGEYCILIWR